MSKNCFMLANLPHNVASLKVLELLKSLNMIFVVSEDISYLHGCLNGDATDFQSMDIFEHKELFIMKEPKVEQIDEAEEPLDAAPVAQKSDENRVPHMVDHMENDLPMNEENIESSRKREDSDNNKNGPLKEVSFNSNPRKRVFPPSFYENRRYCRSKCPVKECGEEFPSGKQLEKHMDKHPGQFAYRCGECDSQFRRSGGLKLHARVHTKERPHACKQCDKKFTYKNGLNIHLATAHAKKRPFVCDQCGGSFGRKHVLASHMTLHERATPYKCDIDGCGEAFYKETLLDTHKRRHTSNIICQECGWVAVRKHHLDKHMSTIHATVSGAAHLPSAM